MVTDGLPTARTQREDTAQPYGPDGNYTTTHANKTNQHTTTTRERPRKNRVDTTNPPPMILDHLAFSPNFPQFPPKLSARAVAALGGSSQVFSDDLLP